MSSAAELDGLSLLKAQVVGGLVGGVDDFSEKVTLIQIRSMNKLECKSITKTKSNEFLPACSLAIFTVVCSSVCSVSQARIDSQIPCVAPTMFIHVIVELP